MEQILVALVGAAFEAVPPLIEAIRSSKTMNAEQKKAALDALQNKLKATAARVAAVKFDDV